MEQTVPATQHASVFEVLSGRFQQTWTGAAQSRALETKAVDTAPSRVLQTLDSLFALARALQARRLKPGLMVRSPRKTARSIATGTRQRT
jgi:hypothetical protein